MGSVGLVGWVGLVGYNDQWSAVVEEQSPQLLLIKTSVIGDSGLP